MEIPGTPIPPPRIISDGDDFGDSEFDKFQKYPLDMLRGDVEKLPTFVNPSRKEVIIEQRVIISAKLICTIFSITFFLFIHFQVHLTHDDFVSVFSMEFTEFETLPKWKQVELKKQKKLF